jgi:hypothetical protein
MQPSATDDYAALPWQQREAVGEAVSEGRAVDDPALALVAVAQARAVHRRLRRTLLVVVAAFGVLAGIAIALYGALSDNSGGLDSLIIGAAASLGALALIMWAVTLRPLERAQQANLHLAGLRDTGAPEHDVSNWVFAWLASLPLSWLLSAVLAATGLEIPRPVGLLLWLALLWGLKRGFDSRDRSGA